MIDYSSFNYQHAQLLHGQGTNTNSGRSTIAANLEPLQSEGGLDVNEVAELVAMRVQVRVAADDFADAGDTAQGNIEFRGVLGANLDSASDLLEPTDPGRNELNVIGGSVDATGNGNIIEDVNEAELRINGHAKDEVFYHFQAINDTPFSSDAGGVGGGGGFAENTEVVNLRDLYGRGPILDSGDDLSFVSSVIKNQVNAGAEATLRVTFVWDVSTVDDAGRRFSVPN